MPIPTGGAWPPPRIAPAYDAYRDWNAWYIGDPDGLRDVYRGRGATGEPRRRTRDSQYAGGVIGTLSRWMWGTPPPASARDARLHVPLPADLARTVASLLYSEPPKLTATNPKVQERLEGIVDEGLLVQLRQGAEAGSFLGDYYLRPVIDEEVFGKRAPLIPAHADSAIPVFRWGQLVEITFWQCLSAEGGVYYRLLEHHDVVNGAGRITYTLHKGSQTDLGQRVPYADHPDALAAVPDTVDAEGSQATGLTRLDVVHVPNAGPQRRWRTQPGLKYLGRSDFDSTEPLFDQVDEAWTSWMRDLRLAKGRITVPDYMLQSNGAGEGASWDPEREVYHGLAMLPTQNIQQVTATQFEIRFEAHEATITALEKAAMRHVGISAQTMGDPGGDAMTATEIQNKERMSFTTRGDRLLVQTARLADALELQLELEAVKFGGPAPVRPGIEFGDSVSEAPETVARTAQLLSAASAASTKTLVEMVHPDWDEKQVDEEVQRIKDDKAAAMQVENPDTFTGDDDPDDKAGGPPPE